MSPHGAAGVEPYFVDLADDFGMWVMFYGPEGGDRHASSDTDSQSS